jgi:hydrogenase nickel incorporation protein HypB
MSTAPATTPRIVEVRKNILKRNDELAHALRRRFAEAGVFVVNVVSSPGSGKTALLERTLTSFAPSYRVAALVGDLATENDASRLARSGVPVRQITTGTTCHLDAAMIDTALHAWKLSGIELLFIENVGNLVCPSAFDLGESLRVVLLSVTEGEDKPLKYPTIFHSADVCLITKIDLAEAVEFDLAAAEANIHAVAPSMRILQLSSKTGAGMDAWLDLLRRNL